MTEGSTNTGMAKNNAETLPLSLVEFLNGTGTAAGYLKALEGNKAPLPEERDRIDAVEAIEEDSEKLSQIVELSKTIISLENSRIRSKLVNFVQDVIRSQDPELENWGRLAGSNIDSLVGDLARRLKKARSTGNKEELIKAERVLQIGVAVGSTRQDFSVSGSLSYLHAALTKSPGGKDSSAGKAAKRAIGRASIKSLETFGAISKVLAEDLDDLRARFSALSQERQNLLERNRDLQERVRLQSEEMIALGVQIQEADNEITQLKKQLGGVRGGAAHDMIELRARFRQHLVRDLAPYVDDALEALSIEPPVTEVTKERLDLIKAAIGREIEWLKQYSD